MGETGPSLTDAQVEERLRRFAARERASAEVYASDLEKLIFELRSAADTRSWSVRRLARIIGRSPAHTHRYITGISGPPVDFVDLADIVDDAPPA